MMRVAYMTTDVVNLDLAYTLAAECDAGLHPLFPKDKSLPEQIAGLVYDLDSLGSQRRREIVEDLLATPLLYPVAVHSYNLEETEIASLQAAGVLVYRRLEAEVLMDVCQAASSVQEIPEEIEEVPVREVLPVPESI
jgi:hypothetical protein